MNRQHQLVLCKKCEHKFFDNKKGIICSLTNEKATFKGTCPDYKEKLSVKKNREHNKDLSSDISNINRYPALKSIVSILNVFAWIVGLITVTLTVFNIFGTFKEQNINVISLISISGFLIQGLFVSLILIAISESIKVLLDIEKNTRNFSNKD